MHNEFTIIDSLGVELGTLRKKLLKLIGEEIWIENDGKELMRIFGNLLEHDYTFESGGKTVAKVHRQWVSLRDQYGIPILENVDRRLVIGATIIIEHIEVAERRAQSSSH